MTITIAGSYVSHAQPSAQVGTYTGTPAACPAGYVSGHRAPDRPGRYTDSQVRGAHRPVCGALLAA